jgi:hypothetical protein
MRSTLICGIIILIISCSESDDPGSCTASFDNDICLEIENGAVSDDHRMLVIDETTRGLALIQQTMPIDHLDIRIVDEPSLVIVGKAVGGFNPSASEIKMAIRKNASSAGIKADLIAIMAHEIHHAKRRRSVGYGRSLLEAVITEGLADHFAIEITGKEPFPWSLALEDAELETWTENAREVWNEPSYNHNAWFFGSDGKIPHWTGYALGFHLVEQYFQNNPGSKASELHDIPAAALVK